VTARRAPSRMCQRCAPERSLVLGLGGEPGVARLRRPRRGLLHARSDQGDADTPGVNARGELADSGSLLRSSQVTWTLVASKLKRRRLLGARAVLNRDDERKWGTLVEGLSRSSGLTTPRNRSLRRCLIWSPHIRVATEPSRFDSSATRCTPRRRIEARSNCSTGPSKCCPSPCRRQARRIARWSKAAPSRCASPRCRARGDGDGRAVPSRNTDPYAGECAGDLDGPILQYLLALEESTSSSRVSPMTSTVLSEMKAAHSRSNAWLRVPRRPRTNLDFVACKCSGLREANPLRRGGAPDVAVYSGAIRNRRREHASNVDHGLHVQVLVVGPVEGLSSSPNVTTYFPS